MPDAHSLIASGEDGVREAIARLIEPEAFAIVDKGSADARGWALPLVSSARHTAKRILSGPLARLHSDLTAAREERESMAAWAKSATQACDKAYIALTVEEANLIALAKMYGEACGELQVLREVASNTVNERDDLIAELLTLRERVANAAETEVSRLRTQLQDSAMQHIARDVEDEQAWTEMSKLRERVARLGEALRSLEESLRPAEHVPFVDPVHGAEVESLGRRIGFGALMSSASASWEQMLAARGFSGGEFVSGPCRAVLAADLRRARAALSSSDPEKQNG